MPIAKKPLKNNEIMNNYINWLKDRNRSLNTIKSYCQMLKQFNQPITTETIRTYLKANLTKYQPNTLKIFRQSLSSYAKFQRIAIEWDRINASFRKWVGSSLIP